MRRRTFRRSDPTPPPLAVTTQSVPTSGGLHRTCSRGSCGKRSAYQAYFCGGLEFGKGGSHLALCSQPTGTAPGWAVPLSSTMPRDAISAVMGKAESWRIQNSPRCGASGGGAEASLAPVVRSFPRLEHSSPMAYKGLGRPGGSPPGHKRPWSPAS